MPITGNFLISILWVCISFAHIVKQADKARGDIPKSTFIPRALEQYMRGKGGK